MKKVLFFLFLMVCLPVTAQDEVVRDVCSVKFGDSFDVAKEKLREYFKDKKSALPTAAISNKHLVFEMPDLSTIHYQYEYYEGIAFDNLFFSFDDNGKFYWANFWIECENRKEAQEVLEEVASVLSLKYDLYTGKNEKGNFLGYAGGVNYNKPDKKAFFLEIDYEENTVNLYFLEKGL